MREIRIDRANSRIVMTSKFAKKADDPRTEEFRLLQEVMETYPKFKVQNHTIKKNPNKERYKGLTYDYMREYIKTHEDDDTVEYALEKLEDLILTSKGHSKGYRYPTIKRWFLEMYPNFKSFGKEGQEEEGRKVVELNFLNEEDALEEKVG